MSRRRQRLVAVGFALVYVSLGCVVGYLLREAAVEQPLLLVLIIVWAAVCVLPISRFFIRLGR